MSLSSSSSEGDVSFEFPSERIFPDLFPYYAKGGSVDNPGIVSSVESSRDASSCRASSSSVHTNEQQEAEGCFVAASPYENNLHIRRGPHCTCCGTKTHQTMFFGALKVPITNSSVYQGHCIQCCPDRVPLGVLQEWRQKKKASQSVEAGHIDPLDKKMMAFPNSWSVNEESKDSQKGPMVLEPPSPIQSSLPIASVVMPMLLEPPSPIQSSLPIASAVTDARLNFQVAEPVPWNEIVGNRRKKGYCPNCGVVRTHRRVLGRRIPLTNRHVKRGHCRRCCGPFRPSL